MFRQPRRGARQERRRQDQPVGDDHRGVEPQCGESRLHRRIAHWRIATQKRRRAHLEAKPLGGQVHRTGPHRLAAPGRPRRLAVDRGDRMPGVVQRL